MIPAAAYHPDWAVTDTRPTEHAVEHEALQLQDVQVRHPPVLLAGRRLAVGMPRSVVPPEPLPPPPAASSETARRPLSTTRRTGTANELALRAALDTLGVPYEVDAVPLPTQRRRRADLVIRPARIAVFSDGCFWHRCPEHFHLPKANSDWWALKLRDVRRRDRDTDFRLRVAGWLPLRFWEHVDPASAARRIAREVARRTS